MKILLYSFLAWIARTWLDCKKKGLSGLIWDISCLQVDIKILLYSRLAWIARTWLDCKNKGPSGFIWVTFQLLV